MSPITGAVVVLGVVVILLFAGGAGLYRRVRELELAVYNGVGRNLATAHPSTAVRSLATPGRTSIILKINRRCPICEDLIATARRIAPGLPSDVQLVVLSDDPDFDKFLPENVRVIRDPDAWRAVTVPYVPALIVVDEQGLVVHTEPGGSTGALEAAVDRVTSKGKEAAGI
jgi:hypothetical protein